MIQALAYLPGIILTLLIIGSLIVTGTKNLSYKLFLYISISVVVWQSLLFVSDTVSNADYARLSLRLALFASMFMPYLFYIFSLSFTQQLTKIKALMSSIPIVLSQIIAFSSFAFTTVEVGNFGARIVDPNIGYTIIVLTTTLYIIVGLVHLYRCRNKFDIQKKNQIKLIILGVSLSLFTSFIANYVLASSSIADYALLATGPAIIFFVGGIGIAIIKHKLFDIRLIVARSLGYIFTLATLVGIYALIVYGLSITVFGEEKISPMRQSVYILLTLIFGFSLVPIKRFFDRLTNKLFYRDAYDAQDLLDRLNKILVGNIDLEPLLRKCAELFETTLKAEYCTFIIRETDDTPRRVLGSKKIDLDDGQVKELSSQNHRDAQIIVTDELEGEEIKIKDTLLKNNVSILARLAPAGKNAAVQGYLILGNKRSGNPYNKQDLQVLDIIANELVIAIQNALRFEEIEAFTVTLQQKVDDATRQLRRTNEKLKALDETKDEFISMASHQLRTPLTAVKGYVSMVVEGDAGKLNKQQKELLDQAFSSSQRMVYLIADLLNVSRLRTGKFVIENKVTQLADVVAGEMEQLKETAKGRDQTLTYTKPDKFPELMLDETKMRQVIMNFTDNALHYTPKGGHISVNLVDKGQSVEFTVVDDGLGVPKSEQHLLFGKFFRAGNARKARPDGTGLGLFMAKKVIIAQGGAIIFTSEEGKGSTFGFTMPKR